MTNQQASLFEQPLFRSIVVGGTGLTLAVLLGSQALITGRDLTGFKWGWSWWSVAWFAAGLFFTRSFWKAVFRLQAAPSPQAKSTVVYHIFFLLILGAGSFLYPIRFLEHENYLAIARGLFTAFIFLGSVVTMLFKIGQGLFARDIPDGRAS